MRMPETTLFNIVKGIISYAQVDYEAQLSAGTPEKSFLSRVFAGNIVEDYDFEKQAIAMFTTTLDHPRRVSARMFFDSERAKFPTYHINLPSERPGGEGMNFDIGYQEPEYDEAASTFQDTTTRTNESTYYIIATSDNTFEVMIMYYVMKMGFQALFKSITVQGFDNLKMGGGDLSLSPDIVPLNVFARMVTLTFSYETSIPETIPQDYLKAIITEGTIKEITQL